MNAVVSKQLKDGSLNRTSSIELTELRLECFARLAKLQLQSNDIIGCQSTAQMASSIPPFYMEEKVVPIRASRWLGRIEKYFGLAIFQFLLNSTFSVGKEDTELQLELSLATLRHLYLSTMHGATAVDSDTVLSSTSAAITLLPTYLSPFNEEYSELLRKMISKVVAIKEKADMDQVNSVLQNAYVLVLKGASKIKNLPVNMILKEALLHLNAKYQKPILQLKSMLSKDNTSTQEVGLFLRLARKGVDTYKNYCKALEILEDEKVETRFELLLEIAQWGSSLPIESTRHRIVSEVLKEVTDFFFPSSEVTSFQSEEKVREILLSLVNKKKKPSDFPFFFSMSALDIAIRANIMQGIHTPNQSNGFNLRASKYCANFLSMWNHTVKTVMPTEPLIPVYGSISLLLWIPRTELLNLQSISSTLQSVSEYFPSKENLSSYPLTFKYCMLLADELMQCGYSLQALGVLGFLRATTRILYADNNDQLKIRLLSTHFKAIQVLRQCNLSDAEKDLATHPTSQEYLSLLGNGSSLRNLLSVPSSNLEPSSSSDISSTANDSLGITLSLATHLRQLDALELSDAVVTTVLQYYPHLAKARLQKAGKYSYSF